MNVQCQKEISNILDCVMRDITGRMVEIRLCEPEKTLSGDICTVETTFEGGYHGTLRLAADTALMTRLTRQVMEAEDVAPQDVEDFAKEYFNVICGHFVARLFQRTKVPARFRIPVFSTQRREDKPETDREQLVLNYTNAYHEGARLIHQPLHSDAT